MVQGLKLTTYLLKCGQKAEMKNLWIFEEGSSCKEAIAVLPVSVFTGISHRTGRRILDHYHTFYNQPRHPHPSLNSDMILLKLGIFSFILPEADYSISLIGYFLPVPTPNSLKITQSFGLIV